MATVWFKCEVGIDVEDEDVQSYMEDYDIEDFDEAREALARERLEGIDYDNQGNDVSIDEIFEKNYPYVID